MTSARRARSARQAGGVSEPLTLIHRSKASNPALARPAARSYSLEWGGSQTVIDAAFCIAVKLHQGGYERTT
jgi:hypothetical protein